jgi:hypothetical protein
MNRFTIISVFALSISGLNAQTTIWQETFGTGCNTGNLANGYTSANGTWTVTATGGNGDYANEWYVSATEQIGAGNCGAGCGGTNNRTLHLGSTSIGDAGAAYDAGGVCGFLWCTNTSKRADSPTIDLTGRSTITLNFNYIEFGATTNDNATLWYYNGTIWAQLVDLPITTCCGGACNGSRQGLFTAYSIALPASADNNPSVKIGFRWVNNDDGLGTDPSFAVDDVRLTVNTVMPVSLKNFTANCNGTEYTLEWSTLSETNNNYFLVESSSDGLHFVTLDRIEADNISAGSGRTYIKSYPKEETFDYKYFRLSQTDHDGTQKMLATRYAYCNMETSHLTVFPNPAKNEFQIQSLEPLFLITIYSLDGKIVFRSNVNSSVLTISTDNLSSGTYIIKATGHFNNFSTRLVIE